MRMSACSSHLCSSDLGASTGIVDTITPRDTAGNPLPRIVPPDLAPLPRDRSKADQLRRALKDMYDRNELVMAELKSQQQALLSLIGDDTPDRQRTRLTSSNSCATRMQTSA